MISFGQPDKVTVERDELEILFSVKEINKLSNEANPCEEDEQYSFSTCLHEFAILKSNCRIDFFGKDSSSNNFCTKDGFKLYIDTLKYLKQEDISGRYQRFMFSRSHQLWIILLNITVLT